MGEEIEAQSLSCLLLHYQRVVGVQSLLVLVVPQEDFFKTVSHPLI